MRSIVSLLACAGIALAVAGCSDADKHYFKEGIGTNLYSEAPLPAADTVASRSELQNQYVKEICHQAGLHDSDCDAGASDPKAWSLFVQAGMNDIDQRCDAYLTWIDNVRRAQAPTIKELADAQSATTIILREAGVGVAPIAIVAAAFGFANNTYNNVMSRLILEVNRSTVQTLVLGRQKKYREELFGTLDKPAKAVISSRPAAIFALRSYLRLCMPMTIETEINSTIATFETGGAAALERREPMISAKSIARPTLDVTKPIEPTRPGSVIRNSMSDFESSIDTPRGKLIQRALCVKNANGDFGGVDSETRKNLQAFKAALYAQPIDKEVGILQSATERKDVTDAALTLPGCQRLGFANSFEVGAIYKYGVVDFRKKLARELKSAKQAGKQVSEQLISSLETGTVAKGKAIDGDMRQAVHILSAHYNVPNGGKISPAFYKELRDRDTN